MRKFALIVGALLLTSSLPIASFAHHIDASKQEDSKSKKDKGKEKEIPLPPYSGPKKRLAVVELELKATPGTDIGAGLQANQANVNTGYTLDANGNPIYSGAGTNQAQSASTISSDVGTGLTEMLTTQLQASNRFIMLERKAMADIAAEQQLAAGAGFDPASATKTGGMLGAQFLVRGAITEFGNAHNGQNAGGNGVGGGLLGQLNVSRDHAEAYVAIDLRIYEVQTGVLLDSVKGEGRVSANSQGITYTGNIFNAGHTSTQTTPLGEAARKAITDAVRKICARLDRIPWEGHVADIDLNPDQTAKFLYIGMGSATGLKVGDKFTIYHPGGNIVDPDTRVILGRKKDTLIGHGVVETVTEKLSTISVTDGTGYAVGDVVKFSDTDVTPTAAPAAAGAADPAATPAAPAKTG